MQISEGGLRERKRLQTRDRLEHAAVDLVLRDGLQRATIDSICAAADVSSRTFFNYFESKEDAILGLSDIELHSTPIALPEGDDVIDAVIGLIVDLTTPALENRSLHGPRSEILKQYPELVTRQVVRLTRVTNELSDAVRELMRRDPAFAGRGEHLAEPVLALCTTAVRTAAREWIAEGSTAPIAHIRERAVAETRNVVEGLYTSLMS